MIKNIMNMDNKEITEIIVHLRKLGNNEIKPLSTMNGVCVELDLKFHFNILLSEHRDLISSWSKFSGSAWYPVASKYYYNPSEAYHTSTDLWGDHEYGDNRREFCLHLADKLEDCLNS